jgi:hypothetical protein
MTQSSLEKEDEKLKKSLGRALSIGGNYRKIRNDEKNYKIFHCTTAQLSREIEERGRCNINVLRDRRWWESYL